MMMLSRLARVVLGVPDRRVDLMSINGVSTDTRTLKPGELFVALRGPNFDGHNYIAEAFAKRAGGVLVDHFVPDAEGPQIKVRSTLTALGVLACSFRMTHPARFVSVSGSNGKTTTKEMIAQILMKDRRVVRAPASYNNDVGVPLTIFSAAPETEFVILELGTNHRGDIGTLGRIARPDIAVITSIGEEHLEGLGDVEGVAEEEAAILRYVRAGGWVIAPEDCPALNPHLSLIPREKLVTFGLSTTADVRATNVESTAKGIRFTALGADFDLPLQGSWNASNALAACAAAVAFGVDPVECARRLREFKAPKMRMELLEIGGISILNDAYNSNPASAQLAVAELGRRITAGKKIAIIGEMRELGQSSTRFHLELGRALAKESSIGSVVMIGAEAKAMVGTLRDDQIRLSFDRVEEARDEILSLVRTGDLVLLKGSRAVGLEKIVKYIAEKATQTRMGSGRVEVPQS